MEAWITGFIHGVLEGRFRHNESIEVEGGDLEPNVVFVFDRARNKTYKITIEVSK
jgi:hypothetical protein